jgi:NadR type nicotinamide-nucleotide adenylyltransferase
MTTTGVVIGKFLPLHAGHEHLIETAAAQVDELTVVLFGRSDEPIPYDVRRAWIAERHPAVRIVGGVDDHRVDFADEGAWQHWAAATQHAFDPTGARGAPTVVFSSEDYGAELARRLGARHVLVDLSRDRYQVSGSSVRADPLAAWPYLSAPVRAWFVRRIAIVGAESTGKTTLARTLAAHYGTEWVPEYGREYSEVRGLEAPWSSPEFVAIARRQLELEDAAARRADRVLICDTDALATGIWHERYVDGRRLPEVEALVRPYDLYLLTMPDVPWVDDGLRDGEHTRTWMTDRFVEELDRRGARWARLAGDWSARERRAIALVDEVLATPWPGATYVPDEPGHTHHR